MTLSAFEVLGVFPELGRLPTPEEDAPGGPSVALLSHALWESQYGSDPAIVGSIINMNGTPREVIGVMPASYDFPTPDVNLWWFYGSIRPVATSAVTIFLRSPGSRRASRPEAASGDARSLIARFNELGYDPSWFEGIFDGGAVVRPLRDVIVGDAREPLLIVLGTVGFVLLIACSNIANLLLVRAEGRRPPNAVRMALGGSRTRLARPVFVESALLALPRRHRGRTDRLRGDGRAGFHGARRHPASRRDRGQQRGARVTAAVSVLAAVLFSVLPASGSILAKTMGALRDGGRTATFGRDRHRTRNALVMTQVALAFVLVIGSGLMVRSFDALRSVDPGFSADNLLIFTVRPLSTKYEGAEAVAQFYDRLTERLEAVPGVTRVGAINALPLMSDGPELTTVIEEFPPAEGEFPPVFAIRRTTPGYFEAMRIPVVEGRAFT